MKKALLGGAAAIMLSAPAFAGGHSKDIVATAQDAGSFSTLIAAVEAAGLVETLQGEGPFTVFAPTDEAFAALPEGTVENLLKPENIDQLTAILTYHVVPGKVMSGDLTDDMEAETVQGSSVTIDLDNGVMVEEASVVTADVEASNGVIHVIDRVILPEG
ncbi:fasciclin domain-containing protein [Alphaproteobacteria bacterium GH1-50]|uniref:Fasciclin domain-containing protein n=1 Tax=Kangsaoukella pontilimi TaxID=2691042 RepID=A0A7C9MS60_9RHOB|nr:fasciclin domain-containing protein [Kangsaoukella pontilimi]MXQ08897.1 fasciclin domain-containing protein [Kangsaoukella pontilimi]